MKPLAILPLVAIAHMTMPAPAATWRVTVLDPTHLTVQCDRTDDEHAAFSLTDEIKLYPFLRRWANIENQTVASSEFTVWETMGPAAAVTGYLMGPGLMPENDMREPAADVRDLPGFWALP